jgi:hypothetical protein
MSPRFSLLGPLLVAFLAMGAHQGAAGVPSPMNSTVPPCFVACPAGDVTFTVVVRDIANYPVANSTVWLDFSACPAFPVCADCCAGITIYPELRLATRVTDASGVAAFPLKLGGVCSGQRMRVFADGVMLTYSGVPVASPDQDGDLLVDAGDALRVHGLIGTSEQGADFDCDGTVTQADFDWMTNLHGGHSCSNVVPARTRSWGALKLIYR